MDNTEQVRREILCTFEQHRPAFDALIDQGICMIRGTGPVTEKPTAIVECAVAFSGVDRWNDTFYPMLTQRFTLDGEASAILSGELHRMFLAYVLSICLHRLVWP